MKKILLSISLIIFVFCQVNAESFIDDRLLEIKHNIQRVNKPSLSKNSREKALNTMIKELKKVLNTKESLGLSPTQINKSSLGYINMYEAKTYPHNCRLFVYVGPSDLLGTLGRSWVFLQYSVGNKIKVSTIQEQGPELPVGCRIIGSKLFITGYLIHFQPNPVYIQSWQLKKDGYIKRSQMDSDKNAVNQDWEIKSMGRNLIFQTKNKDDISVEFSNKQEITIYCDDYEGKRLGFNMKNGEIH